MQTVAGLIAVVLGAIAVLHVYWGFGGVWPGTDRKSCARAVAGFRGIDRMPPPAACFAVAAGLASIALSGLVLTGLIAAPFLPAVYVRAMVLIAGLVFLARGTLGFTPFWRRLTPEIPFARNDMRWFSPLCLLVGAGLLYLAAPMDAWRF